MSQMQTPPPGTPSPLMNEQNVPPQRNIEDVYIGITVGIFCIIGISIAFFLGIFIWMKSAGSDLPEEPPTSDAVQVDQEETPSVPESESPATPTGDSASGNSPESDATD